jgi:hypothetical protein
MAVKGKEKNNGKGQSGAKPYGQRSGDGYRKEKGRNLLLYHREYV